MKEGINIEESWKEKLSAEFSQPYFEDLSIFVHNEYQTHAIYPASKNIFRSFDTCPFDQVKVVILGQDPYHGPDQANGLSFSVNQGTPIPPSLKNIFKEIQSDLGIVPLPHGDLSRWSTQGVLLLNATLTVVANSPGSHQGKGWEQFTNAVIRKLSDECSHLVFMLWGNYAKNKGSVIDRTKHLVLESVHPSPFSAYNGFLGNKHFSTTNAYLKKHGKKEINWE